MPRALALRRSRRPSGLVLAAILMALLLGVLAVLQYRWVGQLSADERERMRTHLVLRADAMSDDFDRELTRAFFWLQVGPEIRRDVPLEADADRYLRWFASSPRPELVKTVYRLTMPPEGAKTAPVVEVFNRAQARLEPADWTPELVPVRDRLGEAIAAHARDPGAPVRIPLVWPDIPALVMPRVQVLERGPSRIAALSGTGHGYTIALLDREYIATELVPTLVERHFALEEERAPFVGVVSTQGTVFTAPGETPPPALLSSPDVRADMFEVRFFEFGRFVAERRDDDRGTGRDDRSAGSPPAPRPSPPPSGREDRVRGIRTGGPGSSSRTPLWHVHVLHRAGSLDAAVTRARFRNLMVSFGVLLLLGVSMGMMLVTTGRARRLASQQVEFVAGVSHELRTPLAVIRSAAENLADGVVSDQKQVRRYGEVIVAEGRRLTQMVEQIMEFAGFESGRTTLDVRPASAAGIVEDALRGAAPHVEEHGATIEHTLPAGLPIVMADPGAVSRSLQNLLVNALKYGGSPPRVTITAAAAAGGPRGEVRITVADNGAGIAPRDLPHIFEPFYRGGDAVARQIHGSGLGLSLVRRIMEEVGGRVTVRSEPGKGSAFTLHLQVAPEAATADTHASAPTPVRSA